VTCRRRLLWVEFGQSFALVNSAANGWSSPFNYVKAKSRSKTGICKRLKGYWANDTTLTLQ
ncbi:hypothetical protein, partial [Pseudomonas gingeri]|uniref:hypothetical protein n=1 Tax=Pseudomonas gingeri TaxID=117681 RepID=UPI001C431BC6